MSTSNNQNENVFRPYTVVSNKKYYSGWVSHILGFILFSSLALLSLHKVIAGFNMKTLERFDRSFMYWFIIFFVICLYKISLTLRPFRRGHLKIEDRLIFPLSAKEKLIKENKEIDESGTPTYTIFSSKLFKKLVAWTFFRLGIVLLEGGIFLFLSQSLGAKFYPNGFWLIRWFDIIFVSLYSLLLLSDIFSDLLRVFKKGYIERDYFKEDFAHVYPSGSKIKN